MIRCAFVLVLCGAVLSACTGIPSMPSFNMPGFTMPSINMPSFGGAGTPVRVESNPSGAEASFGSSGPTCKTPCTLNSPPGAGIYTVTFTLKGYEQQTVPVSIQIGRNAWESSEAGGLNTATVIEPDPVMAELSPLPAAAPAKKRPVAPVKPKPAPKQPTAAAAPPAAPAPAPSTAPTTSAPASPGFSPPPAATQPNVFR